MLCSAKIAWSRCSSGVVSGDRNKTETAGAQSIYMMPSHFASECRGSTDGYVLMMCFAKSVISALVRSFHGAVSLPMGCAGVPALLLSKCNKSVLTGSAATALDVG